MAKRCNFINRSQSNRVLCDNLLRLIAVECLLSGVIDGAEQVASYSKYDFDIATGRHGGYRFIELREAISKYDLIEIQRVVSLGFTKKFSDIFQLKEFLGSELKICDDYLFVIGELQNTFSVLKHKKYG